MWETFRVEMWILSKENLLRYHRIYYSNKIFEDEVGIASNRDQIARLE